VEGQQIKRTRFVTTGGRLEGDLGLRHIAGRTDVPCADQRGPQGLEMLALDVKDTGTERPEHPLVGIGRQEIDMPHINRRRAERLDGIEAKKDAAPGQLLRDALVIEAEATQVMAGGQGDEPGLRRQRAQNQLGRDLPHPLRLERNDPDALPGQCLPGIDVGRIIVRVADHLVVGLPFQAVGNQIQPQRSRAEQCDFITVGIDQPCPHAPDGFDLLHELGAFLRIGGLFGFLLEHIDGGLGEWRHSRMGEENALPCDGKKAMAERLVRENVIDAEIDLIMMLLHSAYFIAKYGKSESLEGCCLPTGH